MFVSQLYDFFYVCRITSSASLSRGHSNISWHLFCAIFEPFPPSQTGVWNFCQILHPSPQSTEIHPTPKKNAIILTHLKKNILSFESSLKESQEAKNKKRMFNRQISPLFCFHFEQWIIFFHHLFHISTFKVNY